MLHLSTPGHYGPYDITRNFLYGFAIFIAACREDKESLTFEDKSKKVPDGFSMATPDGGELKSAFDGPVRSALGEPGINLDTQSKQISPWIGEDLTKGTQLNH